VCEIKFRYFEKQVDFISVQQRPENFQMSHVVNVFQKRFRDVSQNLKVENTV